MKSKKWLLVLAAAILILLAYWAVAISRLPDPLFPDDYSRIVLAEDGEILRVFLNTAEQWIFPDDGGEIPFKLKTAVIHYEDKRFERHWGIDPAALFRALYQNVVRGERISGASTITMQVARLIKPKERTISNKVVEMAQAVRMELKYNKDEILKFYLLHAPFGGNIRGYRAASLRYFGREPQDLSWAQAATLAVLPNNPAYVNPMRNQDQLKIKRDALLLSLHEAGIIDEETYRLAVAEEVPEGQLPFPLAAPHLAERLALGGAENIIRTTINKEVQQRAEGLVRDFVLGLKQQGVQNGAALVVDTASGEVKAYVASQDYFDDAGLGKIDGVRMRRSTGSTLKPLLYALAMDEGLIVRESVLLDIPANYGGYAPYNADHKFRGVVRADEALVRSLNVTAVQLLYELGLEKFGSFLKKAGLRGLEDSGREHGLSLILGSAAGSLWELGTLFRGLGNYGVFGELAALADQVRQEERLLSAGSSYLVLEMLKEVARPGTEFNWRQYQSGTPLAWKTGTSYGGRDAWAVGVSPQWTIAVWAGNFSGSEVKDLSGIDSAAPLLFQLFNSLDKKAQLAWFAKPDYDLQQIEVCAETGYRQKEKSADAVPVWASASAKPLRSSPYEKKVFLNGGGTMQVCSLCWDREDLKVISQVVYPPQVKAFLRGSGSEHALPPHNPQCPAVVQGDSPIAFIYPQRNSLIFVPRDKSGEYQKVKLEAAHTQRQSRLFWYLDHAYLGSTVQQHEIRIALESGWHDLYVIDEAGNHQTIAFYSERR